MTAYYNEIEPYAAEWLRNLIKAGHIPHGEVDTRSIVDVSPDDLKGFTQCHFFAGIGGWGHALRLAGWRDDRPIWTGSCPCQPFSVAGKGAGVDDPRHLWPHFHRLITACRPPVVMGEQVAGAAGYGWLDGVRADLAREGYASRGVDIPACSVDAPHIRQRLYWVATDLADTGHMRWRDRTQSGEQELPAPTGLGSATSSVDNAASAGLEGHGQFGSVTESCFGQAGFIVSGEGCGSGDMADANRERRDRIDPLLRQDEAGRVEGNLHEAAGHGSSHMADTSIIGRKERERQDRQQDTRGGIESGVDSARIDESDMADSNSPAVRGGRGKFSGAQGKEAGRRNNRSGGAGSFWSDHIWLTGSDGKARRSKPGLPLLANGVSNRVGRLRAYGNAIVPQVAAEVIRAFMECEL